MRFYIIIPAHNEEAYLEKTLSSLTRQTLLPARIVLVNDNSTDATQSIIDSFRAKFPFISSIVTQASSEHIPGAKIVEAFNTGLATLDSNYDVICKFDADLIFPENYLEKIADHFSNNDHYGLVGGFCYIQEGLEWVLENLTSKDHIRGALKAYRKACFDAIGGLKNSMGWDTVDELLAKYHNWEVFTDESLPVKHLKPTGANYTTGAGFRQGQAFKKMRYGLLLTIIASAKLALRKKSFGYFFQCLRGFINYKGEFLVNKQEGIFIRKLRWKNIRSRIF